MCMKVYKTRRNQNADPNSLIRVTLDKGTKLSYTDLALAMGNVYFGGAFNLQGIQTAISAAGPDGPVTRAVFNSPIPNSWK